LGLRRTAGTRSCTRARPDITGGEASLAGYRPSLQAAAARGRIIDAEAERRRADQQP
jgi:hypothetical protein